MRPLRCLEAARDLLSVEAFWTQFAKARDEQGQECPPDAFYAFKFSLDGALDCVAPDTRTVNAARKTLSLFHPNFIAYFNDQSTHAQVLAVLDKAIARERNR